MYFKVCLYHRARLHPPLCAIRIEGSRNVWVPKEEFERALNVVQAKALTRPNLSDDVWGGGASDVWSESRALRRNFVIHSFSLECRFFHAFSS